MPGPESDHQVPKKGDSTKSEPEKVAEGAHHSMLDDILAAGESALQGLGAGGIGHKIVEGLKDKADNDSTKLISAEQYLLDEGQLESLLHLKKDGTQEGQEGTSKNTSTEHISRSLSQSKFKKTPEAKDK
jgi:hypothetical protein